MKNLSFINEVVMSLNCKRTNIVLSLHNYKLEEQLEILQRVYNKKIQFVGLYSDEANRFESCRRKGVSFS